MTFVPRKGDWIQTYSGRQFWPMDPRAEDVSATDIAHALSNLCRYTGHCRRFYSVAEHCCHLHDVADPADRAWALLHDASEAYLVDVPRPVKPFLPGYVEAEAAVMRAVCQAFGIGLDMPETVKVLDCRILADELAQNMAPSPEPWSGTMPPLGITLAFWSPDRAEIEFASRLARLSL